MQATVRLLIFLAMVILARLASAETITNTFVGYITKLGVGPDSFGHPANYADGPAIGGVFAGLRSGDRASFSYVYDSSAAPVWVDPTGMSEYALVSWSIAAGAGNLIGAGESDRIFVCNDSIPPESGVPVDVFGLSVQSGYWAGLEFRDLGMDALASSAIPNTFDPDNWDQQIFCFDADGFFQLPGSKLSGSENSVETASAYFRVDGFYSSVPEPSTAALCGTALAALLLIKNRAKNQAGGELHSRRSSD